MNFSLRDLLYRVEPEPDFTVTAPDVQCGNDTCAYRLFWAARLHHEGFFSLPDGGFHQVNLAFMVHPETNQIHAFIIASHEDHEGPWQEFISCDELLDCWVGTTFWKVSIVTDSIRALIFPSPTGMRSSS